MIMQRYDATYNSITGTGGGENEGVFANEKLLQYVMEYVISCRLSPLESRRVAYTPIPFWL